MSKWVGEKRIGGSEGESGPCGARSEGESGPCGARSEGESGPCGAWSTRRRGWTPPDREGGLGVIVSPIWATHPCSAGRGPRLQSVATPAQTDLATPRGAVGTGSHPAPGAPGNAVSFRRALRVEEGMGSVTQGQRSEGYRSPAKAS